MILSMDVFNSHAPVRLPSDLGRVLSGPWEYEWAPIGGLCCIDGMVIADNRTLAQDDCRPILVLDHANSNINTGGMMTCGPDVGCIYVD